MRKMKDSGIEWIGEIPQEWKISKIKYVADFQPICDTSHLNAESIITYTPMEYIKNGYYIENTAVFSNLSSSLTSYCEGDIVIAKVTPCFENGNKECLYVDTLINFVKRTQPKEWARFEKSCNGEPAKKFCDAFDNAVEMDGLIAVMRNGFKYRGAVSNTLATIIW